MNIVNVGTLQENFDEGATIDARRLLEKNLISSSRHGVKILSEGKLTKRFTVIADAFSKNAKKVIEEAGGKALH